MLAWHWISDGRPMVVGETVTHEGPLELCASGLHASERLLDALRYAPGAVVCRVECDGEIVRGEDKFVCRSRRVLWVLDATAMLRAFARQCALDVAHLWEMPDVVRRYLETGDQSLRSAAEDAALAYASEASVAADDALDAAGYVGGDAVERAEANAAWDAAWASSDSALDAAKQAADPANASHEARLVALVEAAAAAA